VAGSDRGFGVSVALPGLGPPHSLRLRPEDLIWGIDSDTRRVSVAGLLPMLVGTPGHALAWRTLSLPGSSSAPLHTRQSRALEALVPFFHDLVVGWGRPTLVAAERPFSQASKSPVQDWSFGVLLAALGLELGVGTDVRAMNPGEWKLPATGEGYGRGIRAFTKDAAERRRLEKARLMGWARGAGYTGESQDEADAVGVVVGAAVMLEARRGDATEGVFDAGQGRV
jgi:hypothetical protein